MCILAFAARVGTGHADEKAVQKSSPEERALRRAYDGAPPVIPHPVRDGGAAECLACHATGFALAGRRASGVPHADFASCTQCHVVASGPFAATASMMARQKGVKSSGVRDVIMFLQLTTGSSTHSAPAFSKSSLTATKLVMRTPLATGAPAASRAEQNIHGLQVVARCYMRDAREAAAQG